MKLSVTEAAVAARCQRQLVLAREGHRLTAGGDSAIGTAAHQILSGFVARGRSHPEVAKALATGEDGRIAVAVVEAFYRELFDAAPSIAPDLSSPDFVRLAQAAMDCAALAAELLARACRSGLRGDEAFERALPGAEERVSLELAGLCIEGSVDLSARDAQSGESWVFDLKTGQVDEASEEQVRLYGRALGATPALVCLAGGRFEIRRVADDPRLDERMASLRRVLAGEATPVAAPATTCAGCAVQKPCWSRWGRTLEDAPARSTNEDARRLEQALRAHRVHLSAIDPAEIRVGPNLVRFRVSLREGEGIAKVRRAALDLQRSMGWQVPPIVENDGHFVAIDAPRRDREVLPWSALPLEALRELEVPIGVTLHRELLKVDLAQAPHLLVAGTTGSGKTVFLKGLILSLLQRLSREECEVAIIDPKMLDFPAFRAFRLWRPVVTDAQDAVAMLQSLADDELPKRTAVLARAGVAQRTELPSGMMPALVVVIDEFADLVQSLPDKAARNQFVTSVQRLLQKSRAVGIHLVIATQRPSVDAIPGILKANLPVRIAFKLPSPTDSGTVLDEAGAENLLAHGDLLMKRDGLSQRAQAYSVTPADIARLAPRP